MTVSIVEVARDLAREHSRRLHAGEPVTVESLLIAVDRCPTCAGPLLVGDTAGRCITCRAKVEPC